MNALFCTSHSSQFFFISNFKHIFSVPFLDSSQALFCQYYQSLSFFCSITYHIPLTHPPVFKHLIPKMQPTSTLGAIMAVVMATTVDAAPAHAAAAELTHTLTAVPPTPSPGFGTSSGSSHLGDSSSYACTRCCTTQNIRSLNSIAVVKIQDCVRLRDYVIQEGRFPDYSSTVPPIFGVGSCQINITPKHSQHSTVYFGFDDIASMLDSTIQTIEASGSSTITIFTASCQAEGESSSEEIVFTIGNLKG